MTSLAMKRGTSSGSEMWPLMAMQCMLRGQKGLS